MKFMIDLIEDIREQIANDSSYVIRAGLLKEDVEDTAKLIYSGEASLGSWKLLDDKKALVFYIDNNNLEMTIETLVI